MLLSHCGEYPCECKNLIFTANSPEMIRLARRITESSKASQMVMNQGSKLGKNARSQLDPRSFFLGANLDNLEPFGL